MMPKDLKLLVVDDMMTMRKLVRKSLADVGLTNVGEADDGETAWAELEKALLMKVPYEIVISDWNMPKMKGLDLLKKVRAHEMLKKTPLILLTAEAEKNQIMEAVKAGVSSYVVKPFSPAALIEKVTGVFEQAVKAGIIAAR